jgi:nitrogenase molybdenum-iron protein alpha chain
MAINLKAVEVEIRERRLHSVIDYDGTAVDLLKKSKCGKLKLAEQFYAQSGDCAEECAESVTVLVQGAAVISHAPVGCSTNASVYNIIGQASSKSRGLPQQKAQIISSNFGEAETIYGASDKLRTAILTASERFNPTIIFIQGSCVSGIIGEDLESIADEMQEKLHIPIVPV